MYVIILLEFSSWIGESDAVVAEIKSRVIVPDKKSAENPYRTTF